MKKKSKQKKFCVDDVIEYIESISDVAKTDYETAHGMEDDLFEEVLKAIATGTCVNPKEVAVEALKVKKLDFARHCA